MLRGVFAPAQCACKCWRVRYRRVVISIVAVVACVGAAAVGQAVVPTRRADAQGGLSGASFRLVWSAGPLADKGSPIAESSPIEATLDGSGPAVVVGDRSGYLYAYHLSDGTPVAGWPVDIGLPIDSTPSAAALPGNSLDSVFVGAGNSSKPDVGGYYGFGPGGQQLWHSTVQSIPGDPHPAIGVQASLTVADLEGGTGVFAGSLDQLDYALDASDGATLSGWPFFAADSVFSTAAAADLYGTGQDDLVVGGASSEGIALGQAYQQGGHVRVLDDRGDLIYDYDTNQEVDSSPAVGDFLSGGQPGIVVGTGSYFAGASDSDTLKAFTTRLKLVWSDTLDGRTNSSPALADVQGNGQLDVLEGTDTGTGGSLWALDGANGATIWHQSVVGRVIGSVVAADLTGQGYEDVLVPTTHGVEVLDGKSGTEVAVLGNLFGFQNSPLVTDDPNGSVGITIAGYEGSNQGIVEHFEVTGSDGAVAVGAGSWPMFHHDPGLSGTSAPLPDLGCATPSGLSAQPGNSEVTLSWQAATGGSSPVTGYNIYESTASGHENGAPLNGSTLVTGDSYTVSGLSDGTKYWFEVTAVNAAGEGGPSPQESAVPFERPGAPQALAATAGDGDVELSWAAPASNGGSALSGYNVYESTIAGAQGTKIATTPATAYTVGDLSNGASYYFEVTAVNAAGEGPPSQQVTALPVPPSSPAPPVTTTTTVPPSPLPVGYRLATAEGQVYPFGKVPSESTAQPVAAVVGIASSTDGRGYWLAERNGAVVAAGDAKRYGPLSGLRLVNPVAGIASTPDGRGYWLVASDGGIFAFGDARLYGSTGDLRLNEPIVGIASTPDGRGYWLVASDGGIFAFGDARYYGSTGHIRLNEPIVGIASTPDGRGYWLVASDGGIFAFGDAGYFGSLSGKHLASEVVGIAP